jgi:deoxyribonuclease-4
MSILLSSSGIIIGTHVPFDKSLFRTGLFAVTCGMLSFQFFMGSPQSFIRTEIKDDDIKEYLNLSDRFPLKAFTHAPYVYNLAGSKDILSSESKEQEEKTFKVIKSLEKELKIVSKFGDGVVLHPGCYKDKKKGCNEVSLNISKIDFCEKSCLLLENMAGQGCMLGSTFQELKLIRDNVENNKRKHIFYCIDTAHIWGSGLYDLRKIEEVDKMFEDINNILGIENIKLFHINDSKALFGSKLDRHELLCNGEIWKENGDTLRYLLNKIKDLNIPCVMETDICDIIKFLY